MAIFKSGDKVRRTSDVTYEGVIKGDVVEVEFVGHDYFIIKHRAGKHSFSNYELVEEAAEPTNNPVVSPSHYQSKLGVQVIDIIWEYFPDNYNLGNVIKYLLRADKKGNRQQDLEKALQYLTWEVERGRT